MTAQTVSSPAARRAGRTLSARQRGFTLLEIMVVVVIIGIMATFVLPKVLSRPYDAQRAKALTDMKSIRTALELYQLDNFDLPTADEGLQALLTPPRPNMPKYPKDGYIDGFDDPWGNAYVYRRPGQNGEYDIMSLGRDGQIGGDEQDADIGHWMKQ
ncbi:MAG: type II secretion system major pseudopilin GspG [Pseudomonadota bacterium]